MKTLRITWDGIESLIKEKYNLKEVRLVRDYGIEGIKDIVDFPEFVEGELK